MKRIRTLAFFGLFLATVIEALGSGMLIPKDQSVPPLAIKHQRVGIRIKDGTATATIEQVFRNSVARDLEAEYVFPLPANASIADFAMYIGGKRVSGELVEKNEARRIYEDIVRRMKDPGLLEHMGGNLFRVRVYPVPKNGEQKIEISCSQALEFEGGLYKYVYPLKTSEMASRTLEDFTMRAELSSGIPIKSIYSPSHKVGISRRGDNEAVIGFEEDKALLDRDFVLYYGVSKKDFGINLITHAVKHEDGFFMLMISPNVAPREEQIVKRDISFVLDTSGSMSGEKIKQAREALQYCIGKLNDGDRFNIVRFSTEVEVFNDGFLDADGKNRKKAGEFIDGIEARGGTAIDNAMATALGLCSLSDRQCVIVFLTDGKPTIGETDSSVILANARKKAGKANTGTRVFVFGVGEDLNAHLLDRLALENGGVSQYVAPGEDIAVKVSSFADKISLPVLAKPRLTFDKLDVKMIHPSSLTDLFAGSQITVFGRYHGNGDHAIRLTGDINGRPLEFVYEGTFPKENTDNDFIPRLWATRRVGYLLDEIRLHGEEQELKNEVVALGKDYGIMTPYTSYLVLEDDNANDQNGIQRPGRRASTESPAGSSAPPASRWVRKNKESREGLDGTDAPASGYSAAATPDFDAAPMISRRARSEGQSGDVRLDESSVQAVRKYLRAEEGQEAIAVSKGIDDMKKADAAGGEITPTIRTVGNKIFYLIAGVWTDRDYKEGMNTIKVKYAGEEYFKLVSDKPELRKYLSLGEKVIVCMDGTAIVVE